METFGQFLSHRLFDDARSCKADARALLGDLNVAQHAEACGHPAHGGIGEDDDVGLLRGTKALECDDRARQLHKREGTFLHARASAGGKTDQGHGLFDGALDGGDEAAADRDPHGAAHEFEVQADEGNRHALNASFDGDDGILLACACALFFQPFGVTLRVSKAQRVFGRRSVGEALIASFVEKTFQARLQGHAHMVAAMRTDIGPVLQITTVERLGTTVALAPKLARSRLFFGGLAYDRLDARAHDILQPRHGKTLLRLLCSSLPPRLHSSASRLMESRAVRNPCRQPYCNPIGNPCCSSCSR